MLRLINDHKNVREISQDPFRHPIWKRFKVHGKGALGNRKWGEPPCRTARQCRPYRKARILFNLAFQTFSVIV